MATINVRRLDEEVVRRLKQRAAVSNRSLESEARHILECAAAKRLIAGPYELHAPRLLASEVANALWRKARFEEVCRSAAGSIVEAIAEMPLRWCEDEAGVGRGDPTRARTRPTGLYDYLALAQRIRGRVVTADGRFARALAPTEHGGTVVMLTDLVQVA